MFTQNIHSKYSLKIFTQNVHTKCSHKGFTQNVHTKCSHKILLEWLEKQFWVELTAIWWNLEHILWAAALAKASCSLFLVFEAIFVFSQMTQTTFIRFFTLTALIVWIHKVVPGHFSSSNCFLFWVLKPRMLKDVLVMDKEIERSLSFYFERKIIPLDQPLRKKDEMKINLQVNPKAGVMSETGSHQVSGWEYSF